MVMKHPGPMDELHIWVVTFARSMTDKGWSGRIVAAPHPSTGGLLYGSAGTPLSAFLAYRVTGSGPAAKPPWPAPPFWGVDPKLDAGRVSHAGGAGDQGAASDRRLAGPGDGAGTDRARRPS